MTWQEVIEHPSLHDLPFKIELNGDGNIVMSPTRLSHGDHQTEIAFQLRTLLPHGRTVIEAGVLTSDNVKVSDVAWFTAEHWAVAQDELASPTAPAICVEVASQSNSRRELHRKKALYFEAGAREVWFCDTLGNLTFFTPEGQVDASPLCPGFPVSV